MSSEKPHVRKTPKEFFSAYGAHGAALGLIAAVTIYLVGYANLFPTEYLSSAARKLIEPPLPVLDKDDYNARMLALAHYVPPPVAATTASSTATTTPPVLPLATATTSVRIPGKPWPVPTVYPEAGALLPFNRIVAYYGNFYSKQMGVLGEYPREEVLAKLASTTELWAAEDPRTPVTPAIQYIVVVAQGSAGKDGMYRLRMPDEEIDKALGMANELHGLLFLDVQVGKSTLEAELPDLVKYLSMPNVHLGIDPEFSMKFGNRPGTVIGTFDAADINYAATFLADLVRENHLPPKVLVVHRFTFDMVTNYKEIRPLPEVQVVMDMDGWGDPAKKKGTYNRVIGPQPVQFTGLKLFYHADLRPPSTRMLTMEEVLTLTPSPIYIQYQ